MGKACFTINYLIVVGVTCEKVEAPEIHNFKLTTCQGSQPLNVPLVSGFIVTRCRSAKIY